MQRVSNNKLSLYAGVSQQPPGMRSLYHTEEMYNVTPFVEFGLVRRQPLEQPDGSLREKPITSNAKDSTYSEVVIDGNSTYNINITDGVVEIIQLTPFHKKLTVGNGIRITHRAARYIATRMQGKFTNRQYSITTIKNTSLLVNKAVIPKTIEKKSETGSVGEYALIWFKHADPANGIRYAISIDGKEYSTDEKDRGLDNKKFNKDRPQLSDYREVDIKIKPPRWPKVYYATKPHFRNGQAYSHGRPVYKTRVFDFPGTPYGHIVKISKRHNVYMSAADISAIQSYTEIKTQWENAVIEHKNSKARRKKLDAAKDALDEWMDLDYKHPTDTETAAKEIKYKLERDRYVVERNGSMLLIKTKKSNKVNAYDSYGNTAVNAFHNEIDSFSKLPAVVREEWSYKLKFKVKDKNETTGNIHYYMVWDGKKWKETYGNTYLVVDSGTMPISMKFRFNNIGSIQAVYIEENDWNSMFVGDEKTNKKPKFFDKYSINDIFFFRNRIGLLYDDGVSMSETGEFYNFFKTTQITTLDTDPIDFIVSTTSSTAMQYAIMNQDRVFLLSDNVQFVMESGAIFGPRGVKVAEVSHYVFDLSVRPVVSANKIILVGTTEDGATIYEYRYNENYGIAEAESLNQHIPGYISPDIVSLAVSNENNMIFVVASDRREKLVPFYGDGVFRDMFNHTGYIDDINPKNRKRIETYKVYPDRKIIYVYKFIDNSTQRVQSAWFKWNYRGDVQSVAAANGMLYIDINHEWGEDQETTVIGTGLWNFDGVWKNDGMVWNMTQASYLKNIQLVRRYARQKLSPPSLMQTTSKALMFGKGKVIETDYKDFGKFLNRSWVDLGEFIFKDRASQRHDATKTMLKRVFFKSDPASLHTIYIRELHTGKERAVGPNKNKKFAGIGLAANYYTQELGRVQVAGRIRSITRPKKISDIIQGEKSKDYHSFEGAFDNAPIANFTGRQPTALENKPLPHLYAEDSPVFVNGENTKTRVVLSSYHSGDKDYGFRIHSVVQEANIIVNNMLQ